VEFAVRRPLQLAHGDRRIELDRLGPGEHHRHPIRLRATEPGTGTVVLRTFSYQDLRGRTVDAGGTELTVVATPAARRCARPEAVAAATEGQGVVPPPALRPTPLRWCVDLRQPPQRGQHVVPPPRRRPPPLDAAPHPVFADTDLRVGRCGRTRSTPSCAGARHWSPSSARTGAQGARRCSTRSARALERGILLLPVLFDGAAMPTRAELPDAIGSLADRHALRVDPAHLHDDLARIEREVHDVLHLRA
jgi:hypothetical protein